MGRFFKNKIRNQTCILILHMKLETWHSYALPKENPKIYKSSDTPLSSADIRIFSPDISNFYYIKKYRYWPEKLTFLSGALDSSSIIWNWH